MPISFIHAKVIINQYFEVFIMRKFISVTVLSAISFTASANDFYLGAGVLVLDQPYSQTDTQVIPLPYFAYYSENWQIDPSQISYSFETISDVKFGLMVQPRYDGYSEDDSAIFKGMEDRDFAVDAGVKLSYESEVGQFEVNVVTDVTGTHEGTEVKGQFSKNWFIESLALSFRTGVSFKSSELVDYYYGVKATEVNTFRAYFVGEKATSVFGAMQFAYPINDQWVLSGMAGYESFSDEIKNSPLLDKSYALTSYLAIAYKF